MLSSMLVHLIYASNATALLDPNRLDELLAAARRANTAAGITGVLLYTGGSFFQVLEGPPAVVDASFAHIERDPRHSDVVTIIREPIAERAFGQWSMGYVNADPAELRNLAGSNDFFTGAASFAALGPGRAKKLLTAFAQGRWRAPFDATIPAYRPPEFA